MADRDQGMRALARLVSNPDDLSGLTDGEVVAAIIAARNAKKTAEIYGAAELRARGWTVDRIAEAVGVHRAQPHRWSQARPGDADLGAEGYEDFDEAEDA